MKTTLNQIRSEVPCAPGWEKLLRTLGKTKADDETLSLIQILDGNGLDDAIWCLKTVKGFDKEIRLFAVWCARQVQHLMLDERSIKAIDIAKKYANGGASHKKLYAAWKGAESATTFAVAARQHGSAVWYAAKSAEWCCELPVADAAKYAAYAARRAAEMSGGLHSCKHAQEKQLRRICAKCDANWAPNVHAEG